MTLPQDGAANQKGLPAQTTPHAWALKSGRGPEGFHFIPKAAQVCRKGCKMPHAPFLEFGPHTLLSTQPRMTRSGPNEYRAPVSSVALTTCAQ